MYRLRLLHVTTTETGKRYVEASVTLAEIWQHLCAPAIIVCQNTSKLREMGIPLGNPLPSGPSSYLLQSPFERLDIRSSSPHASLSHPIVSTTSIAHTFCYSLTHSDPPHFHFRTWQSYHYPATHLHTACYFSLALRGWGQTPALNTWSQSQGLS